MTKLAKSKKEKPIVLSLGGSILVQENINIAFLKRFRKFILSQLKKGRSFIIVCGGGLSARKYMQAAKMLCHTSQINYDHVGLCATELNAALVHFLLSECCYKEIYTDYTKKIDFKNVMIGSGFHKGTSTDYAAVSFAHLYGSSAVYNLTNVDSIYTKDPRKFKDALPLKDLSWFQYKRMIGSEWHSGMHIPFDPLASSLASRLKLAVYVLNGLDLNNFGACLDGKKFKGSIIY